MMNRLNLELKDATVSDAGELAGYGNVTQNVDRAGEIVMPGAYANLAEFVRDGFGAVGHDWKHPVAMIEEAREDPKGLYVRMKFHSTAGAQQCRTIVQERLGAGKSVGLSIGYHVIEDEWKTENGKTIRYLNSIELYEVSIVTVPANPLALVTSAKDGLADEPSLIAHSNAVVDAVEEWAVRMSARANLRAKSGRVLSQANREQLMVCRDRIKEAHDSLSALIDATEPSDPGKSLDGDIFILQMEAQRLGVSF